MIDPLAEGMDVTPFWELLSEPEVIKVVHAGQQDVEPVARLLGVAAKGVFDTQIAAGMVGCPIRFPWPNWWRRLQGPSWARV